MVALHAQLRAWIVPGLAGMIASVNQSGGPQLTRVWAVRPLPAQDMVEIYLQRLAGRAVLDALASSQRAALSLIEVSTYRSRMFKGFAESRNGMIDAAFLEDSLSALDRAFRSVGLPERSTRVFLGGRASPEDMVAVHLKVESAFDQSPKPGAGAPL